MVFLVPVLDYGDHIRCFSHLIRSLDLTMVLFFVMGVNWLGRLLYLECDDVLNIHAIVGFFIIIVVSRSITRGV